MDPKLASVRSSELIGSRYSKAVAQEVSKLVSQAEIAPQEADSRVNKYEIKQVLRSDFNILF